MGRSVSRLGRYSPGIGAPLGGLLVGLFVSATASAQSASNSSESKSPPTSPVAEPAPVPANPEVAPPVPPETVAPESTGALPEVTEDPAVAPSTAALPPLPAENPVPAASPAPAGSPFPAVQPTYAPAFPTIGTGQPRAWPVAPGTSPPVPPEPTHRLMQLRDERDRGVSDTPSSSPKAKYLGAMLDVGFPDGVIVGASYRPLNWLRLQAGAGTNAVSPGLRAGVVLIPFGVGPSLTLEGGSYFDGDANWLASQVAGSTYKDNQMAQRVGYQFANAHLGVEVGRKTVTFFLHGGMSYIHASLHNANSVFGGTTADATGGVTTYSINGDPSISAFMPSFKLGFLIYLV